MCGDDDSRGAVGTWKDASLQYHQHHIYRDACASCGAFKPDGFGIKWYLVDNNGDFCAKRNSFCDNIPLAHRKTWKERRSADCCLQIKTGE